MSLALRINSKDHSIAPEQTGDTVLQILHQRGLFGSKEGCGDGDCGACTINVRDASGRLTAVNSCLLACGQVLGQEVVTVEGATDLVAQIQHPVQSAMIKHAGSQCGYCTPGFIMSMIADYHAGTLEAHSVEGNLCRCTGYTSIRRAIRELAADAMHSPIACQASTPVAAQFCADARVLRPDSIAHALVLKSETPAAQWLAGGTDIGLVLSRSQGAERYIAVDHLSELHAIQLDAEWLKIGAATPLAEVKQFLADKPDLLPAMSTMLHWFAAKQVRNRATLGGNLGTASPIGDLLPVLLAQDAELEVQSTRGARRLALATYFLGYRKTQLADDELITRVFIPRALKDCNSRSNGTECSRSNVISQSYKVGKRGSDDISIVAASFTLQVDAERRILQARLAYGGVAATPLRALEAENALLGLRFEKSASAVLLAAAQPPLDLQFTPLSDFRGSAGYRKQLIVNLFAKFVAEHAHD